MNNDFLEENYLGWYYAFSSMLLNIERFLQKNKKYSKLLILSRDFENTITEFIDRQLTQADYNETICNLVDFNRTIKDFRENIILMFNWKECEAKT